MPETVEPQIPEALAAYFAARQADREQRRLALLEPLTDRERLLVKEAAVMGFVQGVRKAEVSVEGAYNKCEIPGDADILRRTLDGFLSFPDIYPTITGWTPAADEED